MKKFIREYSAYNVWANEKICLVIETLSDAQIEKEIISSFPSIRKTLIHIWDGQLVWISRLEGISLKAFPSESFSGTNAEVTQGVITSSKRLDELLRNHKKKTLKRQIQYATFRGDKVTSAIYQVGAHVFNHNTYHRGQLITMLRQLGIPELPKTDLVMFYREMKS